MGFFLGGLMFVGGPRDFFEFWYLPPSIIPVTWIPRYFPPGITTLAISLQNDSEEQKKTDKFISF